MDYSQNQAREMIGGYSAQRAAAERQTGGYDEPCDVVRPTLEELHTSIAMMIDRVVQARTRVAMHADALFGPRPEGTLSGARSENDSTMGLARTLSAEIAALEHHIARF